MCVSATPPDTADTCGLSTQHVSLHPLKSPKRMPPGGILKVGPIMVFDTSFLFLSLKVGSKSPKLDMGKKGKKKGGKKKKKIVKFSTF